MPQRSASLVTAIVASALLCTAQAGAADPNPLNLPPPRDASRPGTVVLHGGGPLSDEIFERFIQLAGGRQARIVLIPSGTYVRGRIEGKDFPETEAAFMARVTRRFSSWPELQRQGRIASFRFLATDNQQDADDPRFVAALRDATGVWIPAAYQGKLNWRFAPNYPAVSLFQRALRDVVSRGGAVGGLGGGMAALAEIMIMGDSGQADGPAAATVRAGLALFNGAIVDQNFDARGGRLERFTGLLKDSAALDARLHWPAAARSMIGLAVEPRTALLLSGNTVTAIGRQRGHVFLKSNGDRTITWRILAPADGPLRLASRAALAERGAAGDDRAEHIRQRWKNPFGMPEPLVASRPGTVILHGGGGNRDLIAIFPDLGREPRPRLVHCPAADVDFRPPASRPEAAPWTQIKGYFREWTQLADQGRLANVRFITTCCPADAENPAFVAPLKDADAVWFSGGDQRDLGNLFVGRQRPTLFQRQLFDVVRRGGVVGGTSAGAAVMPEIMIVAGTPCNGRPVDAQTARGLGVLRNVVAEQHFQGAGRGGRIERFARLLTDNRRLRRFAADEGPEPEGMIGLAIEERTALIIQENRLRVFGRQKAHVFLKSADQRTITWHELRGGDAAFLYQAADGPRLELDGWRLE